MIRGPEWGGLWVGSPPSVYEVMDLWSPPWGASVESLTFGVRDPWGRPPPSVYEVMDLGKLIYLNHLNRIYNLN